ncbi:hypothetical protein NDU88_003724 [Pleurodeles waltl]|uniref:Uncharacterized protein n=1 Tax=Pleurodeles waltl TaxID=8319 RepID=A0AAV7QDG1_PLEWA|nr:hypothetical protein NDU88_003724 [Pleurodeles waltl]
MTRCGRSENDDSPCSQGNGDAGHTLGNPDIRVPEKTEREDGLGVAGEEGEQNANNDERQETEDERNSQSNEAPSKITGEQRERKNSDTRALRHVPGGTWLTKNVNKANIGKQEHNSKEVIHHRGKAAFITINSLLTTTHFQDQDSNGFM